MAASSSALAQTTVEPARGREPRATPVVNEIDLFMERVLDNRDASWRRLGDFILRETETFDFEAPLGIPLSGFRHEYEWYVREDVVRTGSVPSFVEKEKRRNLLLTKQIAQRGEGGIRREEGYHD